MQIDILAGQLKQYQKDNSTTPSKIVLDSSGIISRSAV